MKTAVRISLIGGLVLVLMMSTFGAGFGSAYLLTGSGMLPWPAPQQDATAPQPTPATDELPSPIPTLTPLPVPTPTNDDEQAITIPYLPPAWARAWAGRWPVMP